ncbi:DNA polymerase III subunit epsilon [Bacillus sp. V3-13]|uniref:exonuclease domain-containing protein n=1 Tax=Bacillus sp. V3-13 TaxID=2053728 RepID=UPI000C763380|nr:exonuclease domain-containing protein [Bacillus sp. V3-13]PLR79286.1 DNA polymerase III subunit epsilon [Bacillus sp. V3-13]
MRFPLIDMMRGIHGKINSTVLGGVLGGQNSQQVAFLRQLQKEMKVEALMVTPLHELNVVVFDIETTGFFPDQGDEMISLGAVRVSGREIHEDEVFYSLVRFEKNLSPEIERLTGITNDQLKDAPYLSEVLIQFFEFVNGDPLVAHHANHEKSFLQNACWKLFRAPLKHRIVDTSFLYRIAEPEANMVRLEDFCEHNGIPIADRHHALGDAKLAAKLWCCYLSKIEQLGCRTLSDIYERVAKL